MKKFIFTLMLATAAGVWTMSEAMCQVNMCTCMWNEPPVSLTGTLDLVPLPCAVTDNEEYPCLPCLTTALSVGDSMYFLTSLYGDLEAMLDTLVYPATATVTGYIFTAVEGGLALDVRTVSIDYSPLPSLCDTWNMLTEPFSGMGPYCYLQTTVFHLTTDTIINTEQYIKLIMGLDTYKGAFREGTNRDIYFVPAGSTHEYLLYSFNAQVGDSLANLWIGGVDYECPNGYNGIVQAISDGTPRKFTITIDSDQNYGVPGQTEWIEGVGFLDNPTGPLFYLGAAVDYGVETILCAYKNGEQVYASDLSAQYGCEYNFDPFNSVPSVQSPETQCTKLLRNGQILILRGDRTYTLTGQKVK